MTNPFVSLVAEAERKHWCMRNFCTTCGAMEFRNALAERGGPLGIGLCEALCDLDPDELVALPRWDEAIVVALGDLGLPGQFVDVLEAWLPRAGTVVAWDDVVLFRFIRHLPRTEAVREGWIRAAIPNAVRTGDRSLVETLLLVLGSEAGEHPDLAALARAFAGRSPQMQRVARRALGSL